MKRTGSCLSVQHSIALGGALVLTLSAARAQSPSMVGGECTIRSFANPSGTTVVVTDPGVEYDQLHASGQRDRVDLRATTVTFTVIPPGLWVFGGESGGDIFEITGLDNANDPEGSEITNVAITTGAVDDGVEARNLTFSDSQGADSGRIWFELVGTWFGGAQTPDWTIEVTFGNEPPCEDLDMDGLCDDWEREHFQDIEVADGNDDNDDDGLDNEGEETTGTDPNNGDTDGDGLTDGDEVHVHRTKPLLDDSDRDGDEDGVEIAAHTDPNVYELEMVVVGDPGNPPDPATGNLYGAVDYAYRLGKYEVTNGEYAAFLTAKVGDGSDPLGLFHSSMDIVRTDGVFAPTPGNERRPIAYVTFYDTLRFANWLHNGQGDGDTENGAYTLHGGTATPENGFSIERNPDATWFLPSEDEWYKAAYYSGNIYFHYPGQNALPTMADTNCWPTPGHSLPVDDPRAASNSHYGAKGMGGNLYEGNEAIVDPGETRGQRGGVFGFGVQNLRFSNRFDAVPTFSSQHFGFRIASRIDTDADWLPDNWEIEMLGSIRPGPGDDSDGDGRSNLEHFAFDTHPRGDASNERKTRIDFVDDGDPGMFFTLTFPVRKSAQFSGSPLTATADGIVYRVLADGDLQGTDLTVVERSPVSVGTMPPLSAPDWEYRSFRLADPRRSQRRGFLWIEVSTVAP